MVGHATPTIHVLQLLWYLEVYPGLSPEDKPIEFVQEAGEVVFIPRGWWHMVRTCESSFCICTHLPLGD